MQYPYVPAALLMAIALPVACPVLADTSSAASPYLQSEDFAAVEAVCTRCHADTAFLQTPRSFARWQDVFARMIEHGAVGSDEQLRSVARFFLENLTVVDVNTSPAAEIGWVLKISGSVLDEVLARREQQRFSGIADLAAVPGVDSERLNQVKDRLLF